jgi:CheY-like chemotaxis protein
MNMVDASIEPSDIQLKESLLAGRCILLVEDEAIVAIDAKTSLEFGGATVVGPADSLGQGFHYLQSHKFDCALLDVNLNSLVVFVLADALIERGIPIIFMSGSSIDEFPPQYRTLRLVSKPFTADNLVTAVRNTIFEGLGRFEALLERTMSPESAAGAAGCATDPNAANLSH